MIDDRCPTVSGSYRCMHGRCHDGPCEAQAPEYATAKRRVNIDPQPIQEPALGRVDGRIYEICSGNDLGLASDEQRIVHGRRIPFTRYIAGLKQTVVIW